jgi:butyrate kinase
MIDPITALAAIQTAVKLVKKVSATVDDVGSLGPVLGKYFTAKENAVKVVKEAKQSGNASNMGTAIQIEMALEQTKQFEAELQMLFMQAGKVDVWNKIKERAGQMDKADKFAQQAAQDRAKAQKEEMDEALTMVALIVLFIALAAFGWFVFDQVQEAKGQAHGYHKKH